MKIKQIEKTEDKFISAFCAKINITEVNINLNFPLICLKRKGINQYVNEPGVMFVDNIMLKLLEKYHDIKYTFICGYYWTGNKDIKIKNVIEKLYAKRQEYKKERINCRKSY